MNIRKYVFLNHKEAKLHQKKKENKSQEESVSPSHIHFTLTVQ